MGLLEIPPILAEEARHFTVLAFDLAADMSLSEASIIRQLRDAVSSKAHQHIILEEHKARTAAAKAPKALHGGFGQQYTGFGPMQAAAAAAAAGTSNALAIAAKKANSACRACGVKGHWAKECPFKAHAGPTNANQVPLGGLPMLPAPQGN